MTIVTAKRVRRLAAGLVVATASVLVTIMVVIPRLTGGAALTVLSGSMTPTYPVGSVVVVRPLEAEDAQVGDVVTFANGDSLTTHRITGIEEDQEGNRLFTTKGDANRGEDLHPVPEEDIRGRVWFHIPMLGYLREFISSATGLLMIAILAAVAAASDRLLAYRRTKATPGGPLPEATAPEPVDAADPAARARTEPIPVEGDAQRHPVLPDTAIPVPRCTVVGAERVDRQLMLLRLAAGALERGQVLELVGLLRADVIAVSSFEMVVTVVGTSDELDGAERLLRPYGIAESTRSEVVSIGGDPEPEITDEPALLLPYPLTRPAGDLELLIRPLSRNGSSR